MVSAFFIQFCIMASSNKNLSDFSHLEVPNGEHMKIAIVASSWNHEITNNLSQGAFDTLLRYGVKEENILVKRVPGTYELSSAADILLTKRAEVDAVVCIGSVVRGETAHFDFVCEAAAQGIKDAALKHGKPVIFGVLTDDNIEQSIDRSGGKYGNKGDEAAMAAMQMIAFKESL